MILKIESDSDDINTAAELWILYIS